MARIRTVKPEYWTSEQVMECSPITRLAFVGMWNFCDDGGNHPASAKTLKAEVFPGDDMSSQDVQGCIDELHQAGLLMTYEVAGKQYWHVTGWNHQKIDKPTIKHPAPPKFLLDVAEDSPSPSREVAESSPPEGSLKETKVNKEQTADKPPSSFDSFWAAYPSKVGKGAAESAWKKLKPDLQTVLKAIEAQRKSEKWLGGYIPNPATWLNQKRWLDEVETKPEYRPSERMCGKCKTNPVTVNTYGGVCQGCYSGILDGRLAA